MPQKRHFPACLRRYPRALGPFVLMFFIQAAYGGSFTLAWNRNPESNVVGYVVYYGQISRSYSSYTNVGNNTQVTLRGFSPGHWFLAVTAVADSGEESDYSLEVEVDVPNPPLNTPPSISSIPNQTLAEDSSMLTVPFTIADLETPANLLTVSAVSSDPSLLSIEPVQTFQNGSSRELHIQSAPDAFGTFSVSVAVSDGDLTTQTQFEVHIHPVNDPPHIDPVPSLVLRNDSGPISLLLTGINCGPTNEQQSVSVFAFSNDPNLLSDPRVQLTASSSSRTLLVSPKPYVTGVVSIQLILVDNGGTDFGGVNFTTENINLKLVGPPQAGCLNDTSPPAIVLKGNNPLYLYPHTPFTDPGASAFDNCAGDLTDFIQVQGSVDTQRPGEYTLNYLVSDGTITNAVYRIVVVKDSIPPVNGNRLQIRLSESEKSIRISWDFNGAETLQLQSSPFVDLTGSGVFPNWQPVQNPVEFLDDGTCQVTLPVEDAGRFFRLGPGSSALPIR